MSCVCFGCVLFANEIGSLYTGNITTSCLSRNCHRNYQIKVALSLHHRTLVCSCTQCYLSVHSVFHPHPHRVIQLTIFLLRQTMVRRTQSTSLVLEVCCSPLAWIQYYRVLAEIAYLCYNYCTPLRTLGSSDLNEIFVHYCRTRRSNCCFKTYLIDRRETDERRSLLLVACCLLLVQEGRIS